MQVAWLKMCILHDSIYKQFRKYKLIGSERKQIKVT